MPSPSPAEPSEPGPDGAGCRFGRRVAVTVRDGHASILAEGLGGDPDTGRGLTALVLGVVDEGGDADHELGVVSRAHDIGDRTVVEHERLEQWVEDVVGGQALVVALIGPQLRGRGLGEHRLGDELLPGSGIAVAAQPVDEGLGNVLDHGEAARRVAVQRGVPGGELALVAGRQHDPAPGVGHRHEDHATDAGLQVLVGEAGGVITQRGGQDRGEGDVHRLDGDATKVDAEVLCQCGGVGDRPGARVTRRHGEAVDVTGTERIDGDGGDQ